MPAAGPGAGSRLIAAYKVPSSHHAGIWAAVVYTPQAEYDAFLEKKARISAATKFLLETRLDPASRAQLVEYVHSLCTHRDVGVLWATHLVDEAESADRVIILHKGHWIASGTAAELRERTGRRSLRDAFLDLTGEASVAQEEAV